MSFKHIRCENVAKENILRRVESMGMQDYVFQALVPEVKIIETKKKGQQKEVITKPFPGYVFIDMIVTDESWYVDSQYSYGNWVLRFIRWRCKNQYLLTAEEMAPILKMCGIEHEEKLNFDVGDQVRIVGGAFTGQVGKVDDIDRSKRIVRVLIDLFGGAQRQRKFL